MDRPARAGTAGRRLLPGCALWAESGARHCRCLWLEGPWTGEMVCCILSVIKLTSQPALSFLRLQHQGVPLSTGQRKLLGVCKCTGTCKCAWGGGAPAPSSPRTSSSRVGIQSPAACTPTALTRTVSPERTFHHPLGSPTSPYAPMYTYGSSETRPQAAYSPTTPASTLRFPPTPGCECIDFPALCVGG